MRLGADTIKVNSYKSEYIKSSYPSSYDDTNEDYAVNDAKRHMFISKIYDLNVPLDHFFLDLRFKDFKMFKRELVEFSTRHLSLRALKMMQ